MEVESEGDIVTADDQYLPLQKLEPPLELRHVERHGFVNMGGREWRSLRQLAFFRVATNKAVKKAWEAHKAEAKHKDTLLQCQVEMTTPLPRWPSLKCGRLLDFRQAVKKAAPLVSHSIEWAGSEERLKLRYFKLSRVRYHRFVR